ncbi:MAG: TIGR01777 family oxidoreductase [Bacteroidales bacterium]|nr:TIGR01777 family oxidoreductase [Bacteroidales bacterium]
MASKKRIIITGISGFIGSALGRLLVSKGYEVIGLTRTLEENRELKKSGITLVKWNGTCPEPWFEYAEGAKAIINLAGANIAEARWTPARKSLIRNSRISAVHAIHDAVKLVNNKPGMIIQASAVGYYGYQCHEKVDETGMKGDGFVADVCADVEEEVLEISESLVKIVRFGIILGTTGGALRKIIKTSSFGIGGYPENGKNTVSWMHLNDALHAIRFIIEKQPKETVFNLTTPVPTTLKTLTCRTTSLKKRPLCLPVPKFFLSAIYGKTMLQETILADQHIHPGALTKVGFRFFYPEINGALKQLLT